MEKVKETLGERNTAKITAMSNAASNSLFVAMEKNDPELITNTLRDLIEKAVKSLPDVAIGTAMLAVLISVQTSIHKTLTDKYKFNPLVALCILAVFIAPIFEEFLKRMALKFDIKSYIHLFVWGEYLIYIQKVLLYGPLTVIAMGLNRLLPALMHYQTYSIQKGIDFQDDETKENGKSTGFKIAVLIHALNNFLAVTTLGIGTIIQLVVVQKKKQNIIAKYVEKRINSEPQTA
jgi:hypothetical protein